MPLLPPMSDQRRFAVVILAAGQGTRMRSDTHKVLHPIASRPLLLHLLDRVDALGADRRVVVVGKGRDQVGNDNAAGEYYLPDVVNIAAAERRAAVVIEGDPYETAGVNSRAELAHLELEWQRRRREQVLHEGATLIDPESVWFAYDTRL